MPKLWTLGGLSLPDLLRRTVRESWRDDVFGQGGRMAFYHFLAIFPSLLVLLAVSARVPHLGAHVKDVLQDLSGQVLPARASQILVQTLDELDRQPLSGLQLFSVIAGAIWAAFNATWAMIWGLNKAYEVEEQRSFRQLAVTVAGLTLSLAVTGFIAVFLIFSGANLPAFLHVGAIPIRVVEWLVLVMSLSLSFGLLYRFAPSLRDHEWRWSMPGALCALILWIGATLVARFYFDRVNDYARSYGQLNGVVMFLLWLYVGSGAILIGGEMNSEIEKAATKRGDAPQRRQPDRRR